MANSTTNRVTPSNPARGVDDWVVPKEGPDDWVIPPASSSTATEKVYYNEAGQPFTLSGKPVPSAPAPPDTGYTGSILPLRRDDSGLHLAVPEGIAAPVRGMVSGGRRLLGVDEAYKNREGKILLSDPLRPLSPDESAAVSLFAGPSAGLARGGGLRTSPLAPPTKPPTPAQSLLQDFETAGVTPYAPVVGQGRAAGIVTQMGHYTPIVASPVRSAVTRSLSETAGAAERSAEQYGTATGALSGGEAVQRGIEGFVRGPHPDSFAVKSDVLYNDFDRQMPPTTQVSLDNTRAALAYPMGRFPSSPELGQQLTNPKLRSYLGAISPTEETIPAQYSSILDANGQPILLQAAQKVQSGGTLTFGELKELRTTIGRAIGQPSLLNDIPKADLKRVYSAISEDLRNTAAQQGPQALRAFDRANNYYRAGLARIDQIDGLLEGSPEQAFLKINRAAGTGPGADVGLLRAVKKSIDPADWNNVGAAVIRRLGEPTAGATDILADTKFSASSFMTNWSKLSDEAKDLLFGVNKPGSSRAALETVARVTQAQKNLGRLANVSRSGEHVITGGLIGYALSHLSTIMAHPIATIGGGAAMYGIAKGLMSPGFARWMYRLPAVISKAPSARVAMQRGILSLRDAMTEPQQTPPEKSVASQRRSTLTMASPPPEPGIYAPPTYGMISAQPPSLP